MKKKYLILFLTGLVAIASVTAQTPMLNSYPQAAATVYLDFSGTTVSGTLWNENGPITAAPAGLDAAAITAIHKKIAAHFNLFNLNITTDGAVYARAPAFQRVRIVVTPDGSWYGNASGVSAIGSFAWGDNTPAFVFTGAMGNDPEYIAAAATHQIGHTLGLQHQSVYDPYGVMISELSGGENNILSNEAPLMGIPFYKNAHWIEGTPSTGARDRQNDTAMIAGAPNNIGYRPGVHIEPAAILSVELIKQYPQVLAVRSRGFAKYRLEDHTGKLIAKGFLKKGYNKIATLSPDSGVLLLSWAGAKGSGSRNIIQ